MVGAVALAAILGRAEGIVSEFWTWWTASLMALVPASLRGRLGSLHKEYILDATRDTLKLLRRTGRNDETLVQTVSRHANTTRIPEVVIQDIKQASLRLGLDLVVIRHVKLPLAAEKNAVAILRNEINRVTPFSPEKTYFDYVITSRDPATKTIQVTLVVAKRELIDELVNSANGVGIKITRAVANDSDPLLSRVDLLRFVQRPKRSLWAYANAGLVMAALVLAGLILTAAYDRLDHDIQVLSRDVAQKRAQAAEVADLKKKLADLSGRHAFLDQKKIGPAPLIVMHEITKALSDQTWVSQLQIAEREVRLSGFSKDAATVLTDLQEAKSIRNPRFRSPLTQSGNWERFDLTVDLAAEVKP